MLTFQVNDMSCAHCVSSITKAVQAIDKDAVVTTDLAQHLVHIRPTEAASQELKEAIAAAGYTPVSMDTPVAAAAISPRSGGCCCGPRVTRCG